MSNELILRFYKENDETEILRLRKSLQEIEVKEKNSLDYWYYENIKNPAGKSIISLAFDGNKLVSQFVFLPKIIKYYNKQMLSYQSLEVMTAAPYRRQGLFTKLGFSAGAEALKNNCEILWAFPNQNSIGGFLYKFNWKKIFSVPVLVRALDCCGIFLPAPLNKFGNLVSQNIFDMIFKLKSTAEIEEVQQFDNTIEELLEAFNNSYNIIFLKNVLNMNWRYTNVPNRIYKKYLYKENGKIKGIAVFRTSEFKKIRIAVLMDLFVRGNGYIDFLKQTLVQLQKKEGIKLVFAMFPEHINQFLVLKKCGFIVLPEKINPYKFNLTGKPTENFSLKNSDDFYDFKNWYISFGDNDVF